MNDQKNKQQQPQQGNKQDNDQQKQHTSQNQNPQNQSKSGDQQQHNKDQQQHNKSNMPQQGREPVQGEMDEDNQPEKSTQIDDNPDETKKKIPNMQNKH